MAILSSMGPASREKYIGWGEAACGLGLLLGPLMGAVLYDIGGYVLPFATFAGIYIIIYPYISCVLCFGIEK